MVGDSSRDNRLKTCLDLSMGVLVQGSVRADDLG